MGKSSEHNNKTSIQILSTDWLENHLKDENLMFLDAQPNHHDYMLEHFPTELYLNENIWGVKAG